MQSYSLFPLDTQRKQYIVVSGLINNAFLEAEMCTKE